MTQADSISFTRTYLREVSAIAGALDPRQIDALAEALAHVRDEGGRLFFLGVGGGAGHAGHAVNDFRKIAGFEAYAPTDNVSELTARINDDGWESSFAEWLRGSRMTSRDALFVLSVGGGDALRSVSVNLVRALEFAQGIGSPIFGIVGRDGGFTAQVAQVCLVVPTVNPAHVTLHTEGFQAVLWHLLVGHPALKRTATKWESVGAAVGLPRSRA
jgi:D-sedoheptulose 7-phosphate isomerase